jgi:hypothetical protein
LFEKTVVYIANIHNKNKKLGRFLLPPSKASSTYLNFGAAQTLSLVAVGALLSSPKQALHFVHFNAFDALVNFPAPHALHIRSVMSVPGVAYVPALQFFHA